MVRKSGTRKARWQKDIWSPCVNEPKPVVVVGVFLYPNPNLLSQASPRRGFGAPWLCEDDSDWGCIRKKMAAQKLQICANLHAIKNSTRTCTGLPNQDCCPSVRKADSVQRWESATLSSNEMFSTLSLL